MIRGALLAAGYFLAMIIVHELGHIAALHVVSDAHIRVSVWPGYELYPMPGQRFRGTWPARGVVVVEPYWILAKPGEVLPASILATRGNEHHRELQKHSGLLKFMGAGATTLLSLICLILLTIRKPRAGLAVLFITGALLHVDMLSYTIFPLFLDAPHLYFFGGSEPEPLNGLVEMGLPQHLAVVLIALSSAAQLGWLFCLMKCRR
ncbi:MAG: hypothetical protein ACO1PZ_03845 [Gammaproteobacteria bacterium]